MFDGDNSSVDSREGVGEGILGFFYLYDTVEKSAKSRINLAIICQINSRVCSLLQCWCFCEVHVTRL